MRSIKTLVSLLIVVSSIALIGCGGGGGGGGGGDVAPVTPVTTPPANTAIFNDPIKSAVGFTSLKSSFSQNSFAASVKVNGTIRNAVSSYDPATGIWTVPTINPQTGNAVTIYARVYIGTSKTWGEGTLQKDINAQTTKIEFLYTEYFLINGNSVAAESVGHIIKMGSGQYIYNETGVAKVNGLVALSVETNDIGLSDTNQYPTSGSLTVGVSGEGSAICGFNGTNQLPVKITRITGAVENYTLSI